MTEWRAPALQNRFRQSRMLIIGARTDNRAGRPTHHKANGRADGFLGIGIRRTRGRGSDAPVSRSSTPVKQEEYAINANARSRRRYVTVEWA